MQIRPGSNERLLRIFNEAGLKVDSRKVKRQLSSRYNIISIPDKQSSHTADFIIQAKGKLERRAGTLLGIPAHYQTPEALVLAKLRMIKATLPRERSLKDREDIRAIIHNTEVDKRRIFRLARRETTLTIFHEVVQEESGINPNDPIFHVKPVVFRDRKSRVDRRASEEVDKIVYGEELSTRSSSSSSTQDPS